MFTLKAIVFAVLLGSTTPVPMGTADYNGGKFATKELCETQGEAESFTVAALFDAHLKRAGIPAVVVAVGIVCEPIGDPA